MGYVLIVDDEPNMVELLDLTLKGAGLQTRTATDGEKALAQIEKERPGLILLDLYMPGVSGYEVLRRIKKIPATSHIPIVVVTANHHAQDMASELGVRQVMVKTRFRMNELCHVAMQYM